MVRCTQRRVHYGSKQQCSKCSRAAKGLAEFGQLGCADTCTRFQLLAFVESCCRHAYQACSIWDWMYTYAEVLTHVAAWRNQRTRDVFTL